MEIRKGKPVKSPVFTMNLLIHDLNEAVWSRISAEYEGWTVVADNGDIKPCTGCFCCWNRMPGSCVIKDGYENMGYLIHHADEVHVISRYTYGGFSGSVKGVFDRCLGYVLPQFEVINGETHHKKRYDEDKPFTFIFYGRDLSEEEKESARRYVRAVCANFRAKVQDVIFLDHAYPASGELKEKNYPQDKKDSDVSENNAHISDDGMRSSSDGVRNSGYSACSSGNSPKSAGNSARVPDIALYKSRCPDAGSSQLQLSGKTVLLNGSMRTADGNSARFAGFLKASLQVQQPSKESCKSSRKVQQLASVKTTSAKDIDIVNLKDHLRDMSGLVRALADAAEIVLCVPLYVDGLPAQVIKLMETFEAKYCGEAKRIYLLANMGLYESGQLVSLFTAVKQWCGRMGFEYSGGLGISAGELLGTLLEEIPPETGPNRNVSSGIKRLADAIRSGGTIEDIFAEPHMFPRSLYILIANTNWNRTSKKNGIRPQEMYRRL